MVPRFQIILLADMGSQSGTQAISALQGCLIHCLSLGLAARWAHSTQVPAMELVVLVISVHLTASVHVP